MLWSDTIATPSADVDGPMLPAGEARFSAAGTLADRPFVLERPFDVGPADELIPGPFGEPLTVEVSPDRTARTRGPRGAPPVWPFAAAALLLCAEWLWRRRFGLR